jgi:hypothetical protein
MFLRAQFLREVKTYQDFVASPDKDHTNHSLITILSDMQGKNCLRTMEGLGNLNGPTSYILPIRQPQHIQSLHPHF